MGNGRVPGPVCSTRVGDDWIDDGTLCRAKSSAPGPVGVVAANPAQPAFDKAHGYSTAPEARRKRAIDLQIIGGDYTKSGVVSLDNEGYLKELIQIASGGKSTVQSKARDMQFFIVRGGAEGFLPDLLRADDARNHKTSWTTTDGTSGETDFNEHDLLAVFDADGKLISAARLSRPTYVQSRISRGTAARVYDAWNGKRVFIYRNATPGWVPYVGLALDDGFRDGSANKGGKVFIDMHKQEDTNGCIFIDDDTTPTDPDALLTFEPVLIKKIMASKKISEATLSKGRQVSLGTMHVVRITL